MDNLDVRVCVNVLIPVYVLLVEICSVIM